MRNSFLILLLFSAFCSIGIAQQTPIYSQYVLSEFIINPALAGIDGMTSINFTGRKQWLGWEYAPNTYSASVSTRILKSVNPFISKKKTGAGGLRKGSSGRVGLGASVIKDQNGAINKTSLNLTYAYHIPMYNSSLSFGLTLQSNQFSIDAEKAKLGTPGDPVDGLIGTSTYSPDAAIGVNFSTQKYHAGISMFNLFQSPVKFGEASVNYKELKQVRHYYLLATYHNKISSMPKWEYEPAIVARGTEQLQGSAEISIRFIYEKQYWFGMSFRTSADIVALMGVKLNRFYFGYSFDYGFNEISHLSYGSHEILLAIKLGDDTRRYRWWERY
jgi:type IX secretion system PorP/SprF family membrane protein